MTREIRLTKGHIALVDDDDYDRLTQGRDGRRSNGKHTSVRWCSDGNGMYAIRSASPTIFMHRVIMNAPIGVQVDHINGNSFDNRKANLRLCSHRDNSRNRRKQHSPSTSGYKGVSFDKQNKKWVAYIKVDYKQIRLGFFDTAIEGAQSYDAAAALHFGEFAKLNRPRQETP